MRIRLACRNLSYAKVRSALAVAGVSFATVLVFLQLGFYGAVVNGATLFYNQLDFDLFMPVSGSFTRRRLYQALALDDVERADPFYVSKASWRVPATRSLYDVIIFAFDPDDPVFLEPSIIRQAPLLKKRDTVLVDSETRPIYGPRAAGDEVEIGRRRVTVAGESRLGTAFVELGIIVVADRTLLRIDPRASLENVSIGLVKLRPGADPQRVKEQLRSILPGDVNIRTRTELNAEESHYWITATSTGLIISSGAVVAVIVGVVIMYQSLSSQVTRHLPEYATMKALGYTNTDVSLVVLLQGILLAATGFFPAWLLAALTYDALRKDEFLPVTMPWSRVVEVFCLSLFMASLAGILALRKVRRADPADLY
jgi:putative ABC transport system permease protein